MTVQWDKARERSLLHWRRLLDSIGRRRAMAIVCEVNELEALCEMAGEQTGDQRERCRNCVVFADAGNCADTRLDISAFVLNGETRKARAATLAVVERIAAACRPELS